MEMTDMNLSIPLHLMAFVFAAVLLSACAGSGTQNTSATEPVRMSNADTAQAQTFVYECSDGYSFTVRIQREKAWLFLPGTAVALEQVVSASGAKYTGDGVTFWSKGEEALLEVGTQRHQNCRNNPAKAVWESAKLSGVDFRAVGNEPGWNLEIREGKRIVFVTDYGKSRLEFAAPEPETDRQAVRTTYQVQEGGHDLAVILERKPCRDIMSGEAFETTVTVRLDEYEYRGCGRALH
jgi:membrane-bound inhibitor of C-type lysozyme